MKNLKSLMALLLGAVLLTFTGCKDDDDGGDKKLVKPVYGTHFTTTVSGNTVTLECTMAAATSVIWEINDKEYTANPQAVDIPIMGTYPLVLSVSEDGLSYLTSDTVDVIIPTTNTKFLEHGLWKALTGGPDGGKTWVLDLKKEYFHAIADYYGDEDAGATGSNAWGPWGGGFVSEYDMGGSISFDGATATATLVWNGKTTTGKFSFEVVERPTSEEYINYGSGTTDLDLWEDGFINGPYSYLSLSDSIGKMQLEAGMHFPLDSGRWYNNAAKGENTFHDTQFLPEDVEKIDIVHLSDSALVLRVKRTYEKDEDPSKCWMLYNYIVKGYNYDTFVAPDRPATSGQLEDGTYKLAEIPGYYYNWRTSAIQDSWDNIDTYKQNMAEWWVLGPPSETILDGVLTTVGQAVWDAAYSAYTTQTIVISGSDITINHKSVDVWGTDSTTINENTIATTFTQANGVITFADSVSVYCPNAAIDKVKEMYILPGIVTTGIGIGIDDINEGDKWYATKMQNWIKQ